MLLLFYLSIGSPEHNGKNVISYVKIILVFQWFDAWKNDWAFPPNASKFDFI